MQRLRSALLNVAGWLSSVALRIDAGGARSSSSIESAAAALVARRPHPRSPRENAPAPPSGYVAMSPRGQLPSPLGSAVILASEEEEIFVPVFVAASEALALRLRLAGETFTRPLTHDLLDRLLALLEATVDEVRIEELRGQVFVASVAIRHGEERTVLDSRASDAVIIAVGHGLPVLVSRSVIETAGRPLEDDLQCADA